MVINLLSSQMLSTITPPLGPIKRDSRKNRFTLLVITPPAFKDHPNPTQLATSPTFIPLAL